MPDKNQLPNQLQFDLDIKSRPSLKQIDNFSFDIIDCTTSPIITYSLLWASTLPKDVVSKVPIERLIALMTKQQKATLSETILYLYTASLEFPLSHDWAEIYTYCGLQFAKRYRSDEIINEMKHIAPSKLSLYFEDKLNNLQYWIHTKRRKALKQRLKTTSK